jgi:amidase
MNDTSSRRAFLKLGVLGAAGAAVPGAAAQSPNPRIDASIQGGAGVSQPPFELEELTIADLHARLDSGQDTVRSLVQKYIGRIEALDRQGPALRHVLEVNPDALEIADRLDAERRSRRPRGPLHGIPVLVKDNVGTADRMTTTAGSLALEGSVAPKDAFVARQLRAAGAVILGKTNLSEWANFRSTHSSSGWSGRGGQGRNPYALDRNPSGSSSGTGGAITASYAAVGVGSETDGSIVSPSNNCGLVGIKPTLGLVSRAGIVPLAHSQDTAGPMARTVADAAILLGALVGPDPDDRVTAVANKKGEPDYTRFLDLDGLKGARIGIPRKAMYGQNPPADRITEGAIEVLRRLGAVIVDPADLPSPDKFGKSEFDVLLYEFKADLNAYLAGLGPKAPARTLKDLIAFNEQHKDREMPYFGQEIFVQAQEKGPLTEAKYKNALATCRQWTRTLGIDAVMTKHRLDAFFAPTSSPATLIDLVNGDYGPGGSSSFAAVAGYPHITLPGGFVFGLPVGVSFFGRPFSEPKLIRFAYAFEQATRHRRAPKFLPTATLGE